MDDQQVGAALRAIRIRQRWRQKDLAAKAKVSRTVLGRIEHGRLAAVPLGSIRRVAGALDARLETFVRWHGGDLGRLINARHAAMHEAMARLFTSLDDWVAEPEVSFSVYGERGVIDILAWHATLRALLVIELKTEIVDVNDLMGTLDRKHRIAAGIARSRGWDPGTTSSWVVVADSRSNRRAVAAHSTVLRSKYPVDGRTVHGWLRRPGRRADALSFLPAVHEASLRRDLRPVRRVTCRETRTRRA